MAESFPSSSTWTGPIRPPTAPARAVGTDPAGDPVAADAAGPLPVAFRTLGCKVNQVESEDIAAELIGRGVRLVAEENAAVVVINTCTVTAEADRKARKAVRHALAQPGVPLVVVTGCMAAVDAPSLRELGSRVIVEPDKERVAERVSEIVGAPDSPHEHAVRAGAGFHTRAMLKVEDGCDNYCTYCIVPYARGVPRSVPLDRVLDEARRLAAAGVPEIVVTGINVGRYRDPATGADLSGLIAALGATGVPRVRLSSIEPPDLTPGLLRAMADTSAFCAHLHVPLQSGSDRVLTAMGRGYTLAEYVSRLDDARRALPDLSLTTDVLVGFPGETESDADETRAACERLGFSKLHVFRYSRRPGTPAADMEGQLEPGTIAERAERLRTTGDALRQSWLDAQTGRTLEVLVERTADGHVEGTTRGYAKVRVAHDVSDDSATPDRATARPGAIGSLVAVRVTGRVGDVLLGEAEGEGMADLR